MGLKKLPFIIFMLVTSAPLFLLEILQKPRAVLTDDQVWKCIFKKPLRDFLSLEQPKRGKRSVMNIYALVKLSSLDEALTRLRSTRRTNEKSNAELMSENLTDSCKLVTFITCCLAKAACRDDTTGLQASTLCRW